MTTIVHDERLVIHQHDSRCGIGGARAVCLGAEAFFLVSVSLGPNSPSPLLRICIISSSLSGWNDWMRLNQLDDYVEGGLKACYMGYKCWCLSVHAKPMIILVWNSVEMLECDE
jgi:hypothetical protein